ncbi:hypothetical protein CaCOL14_006092 [Colletotrichum acutatum]|uniref:protein-ribulosamine 3-kinase n=1 Tax=Glomerella acutata TaxID=27357 RepID=A0AAD8UCJ0_GLOAC|nr:Fructosamine kinase-domain-containing protein [Colletotrichum acutatum]KAK1719402.1 Fructosamine kinase-domain-containing protein [Colletotrichum acutatum]
MESGYLDQAEHAGGDCELDVAVFAKLPTGCSVLKVAPSGHSLWVATVQIVVQLEDGTIKKYFKKGARGAIGMDMMRGTFEAEQALYTFSPGQVPKPIGWGTYTIDPGTHFYLSQFVEMREDLPSAQDWAASVRELHVNSMGKCLTRKFGFHVNTYLANVPVNNSWNSSWESFWRQQMKGLFDQDDRVYGMDNELTALKMIFLYEVIPRYLSPLEREGRSVIPCLIHSDLWPGNIKPKKSSSGLCMFDACAYWGHNEADLGICLNPRYKLGQPCIHEYLKRIPAAEPTADFDGRIAVYAMKYHALLSIMYCFKDKSFRQTLKNELKEIIGKAAQSMPEGEGDASA